MTYAEIISKALNKAVSDTMMQRGEFIDSLMEFTRKRKLPLETTIKLLLSMNGGSLKKELYDSGIDVTTSAFVQQRTKISSNLFRKLLQNFNQYCIDENAYKGYRVLAVDGTCVNMSRNPQMNSFVCNASNPKGYNQMHVNPLYDVCNKTYYDCVIQPQPKADEIGALLTLLYSKRFYGKNIIVADRGYESYNVFAHLLSHGGVDFLIRVKQDRGAMREIAKLPMVELDRDVSFTITTTQTNEDKRNDYIFLQTGSKKGKVNAANTRITRWDFPSPYPMSFRVIRFLLDTGEYETLVTSLPRNEFSIDDLKELYHMRWGIETSFRNLKYCIGLVNLHGKCDEFVQQEIYAALVMYNFCNRISDKVVIEKKEKNVYAYKVNLKMAIYLCKEFYRTPNADGEKLMQDIARYTEPVRPGRRDERNIKAKSFVGFTYRVPA